MARKLHVLRLGPGEERILLAKLQAGERGAFRTLHHHYIGRVLGLAQQLLGSAEAAEDAAQETFLRVFRNLHRFRGDASLATWIHRIATNVCFSELKRRQRRIHSDQKLRANEEVLELEAVSLENPTLALENRILAQQLSRLLSELDPKNKLRSICATSRACPRTKSPPCWRIVATRSSSASSAFCVRS